MFIGRDFMKKNNTSSLAMLVTSMLIFGTIGIFRKYIPLSSAMLACSRGFMGGIFLLVCVALKKEKLEFKLSSKQWIILVLTGILIGLNWILLFESFTYTSVAISTLCYYMEPSIVILLSPIMFKEKLGVRKIVCVIISFVGIALVSGITDVKGVSSQDIKGVIFGLGAAVLYSSVVILNKKNPIDNVYVKTIIQLFSAAIILIPYLLITENFGDISLSVKAIVMIVIVGIVHTGIAYALYFGSMDKLRSQTVAIMSYIDPIFAIVLSAVLLRERMSLAAIIGAIMVIGAAVYGELEK